MHAKAGTLTVNGNLTVATNLTAQSINLGGVTQTNWNFLPLQGYKYVIVAEGTNDTHRGNNLRAAYATATTLGPTVTNRVVVIVPPGTYNFGTTNLVMSTSYVDLIGLVPAQMTTRQVFTNSAGSKFTKTVANVQCPVRIYASNSVGTIVQNVDYVRIESVILSNTSTGVAYYPAVSGTNTVLRHVSMASMRLSVDCAGQYVDCFSSGLGFSGETTGTFIDCVVLDNGFGGNASGTFINCSGGGGSFGEDTGASGTFIGCTGGDASFGSNASADGTFIRCVAGNNSFGGMGGDTGSASGEFIDCIGGVGSFGGDGGTLDTTAKLQHCKGGAGSFGGFNMASDDFNYNVGGANTFLMLPNLPASTNGLPSGTVYSSSGALKIMP
jgi:hypothetical protein